MTIPPAGLDQNAEILDVFNCTSELAKTIQSQNWSHIKMQHCQWVCQEITN